MRPDCGVVIVGGGAGKRMGDGMPKQFRELLGKPLFLWSAEFFARQPDVCEVVLVVPAGCVAMVRDLCANDSQLHLPSIVEAIVEGGSRRQDSVRAGIAALSGDSPLVAIHDAARPFPPSNFDEAVEAARQIKAAIFARPVGETLKQVHLSALGARVSCPTEAGEVPNRLENMTIQKTIDRTGLWAAQTPQIFRKEILLEALDHCEANGIEVTDEAAAVEAIGGIVRVVHGSSTNLKVTTPADWALAEVIAANQIRERNAR